MSISSTSSSLAVLQSFQQLEAQMAVVSSENHGLKEFLRQKERDIEKLQQLLSNAEDNLMDLGNDASLAQSLDSSSDVFTQFQHVSCAVDQALGPSAGMTECCLQADSDPRLHLPPSRGYVPATSNAFCNSRKHSHDFIGNSSKKSRRGENSFYFSKLTQHRKRHTRNWKKNNFDRRNSDGGVFIARAHCPSCRYANNDDDFRTSAPFDDGLYNPQRLRRRRTSSTPSVVSSASLSKLSRLKTDLSTAMDISNALKSTWAQDMELNQRPSKHRSMPRDSRRRRTAIGIREITDSIIESYDFQKTFDNHSFVSECLTAPHSDTESNSFQKNVLANSHNLPGFRNKRKQYNKQDIEKGVNFFQRKQTLNNEEPKQNVYFTEKLNTNKVEANESAPAFANPDSRAGIGFDALYVTGSNHAPISFIPATNISALSLKNQAMLSDAETKGNIAVITSDSLYPQFQELRPRPSESCSTNSEIMSPCVGCRPETEVDTNKNYVHTALERRLKLKRSISKEYDKGSECNRVDTNQSEDPIFSNIYRKEEQEQNIHSDSLTGTSLQSVTSSQRSNNANSPGCPVDITSKKGIPGASMDPAYLSKPPSAPAQQRVTSAQQRVTSAQQRVTFDVPGKTLHAKNDRFGSQNLSNRTSLNTDMLPECQALTSRRGQLHRPGTESSFQTLASDSYSGREEQALHRSSSDLYRYSLPQQHLAVQGRHASTENQNETSENTSGSELGVVLAPGQSSANGLYSLATREGPHCIAGFTVGGAMDALDPQEEHGQDSFA